MYVSVLYIVSFYRHVRISVLYIVSIYRHVGMYQLSIQTQINVMYVVCIN